MEYWSDQGIVLAARQHGEGSAVVSLLTKEHGRHAGYVRGVKSAKMRGTLEPGTLVSVEWRARIADNLGSFSLEQESHTAINLMNDPLRLGALLSACNLCDAALPERETNTSMFHGLQALLNILDSEEEDVWGAAYIMWELALLKELGFGIDLSKCAGGGDPGNLAYVSPKSGAAVSLEAGGPYKDKLLPLPAFLQPKKGEASPGDILKGLQMTGYFLEHRVFAQHGKAFPEDRLRFHARFAKYVEQEKAKDPVEGVILNETG